MGIATAIGLGASAIGGLLSSNKQNKIAGKQADATTAAAEAAAGVQRQNFLDTAALYQPRAQAGDAATARMLQLMGLPVPEAMTSGQPYEQVLGGGGAGGAGGNANNLARDYFKRYPDVAQAYQSLGNEDRKYLQESGYEPTPAGFAKYHFETYGQAEGRSFGGGAGGATGAGGGVQNGLASNYALDVPDVGAGGVSDLIKSTPGYEFRFNEGINAVDSSAANRGMLMSGSQMRRLQEFGDDYAAREFGNYWNRLSGLAGAGGAATSGIASAGANQANNLASIYQNEGQGLASSYGNRTSTAGNTFGMIGGGMLGYYG